MTGSIMTICKRCLLVILMWPFLSMAGASVEVVGSRLIIRDVILDRVVTDIALAKFKEHDEITEVELRNVPGGLSYAELKLYGPIANKKVVVTGLCASMCAILALSAREISIDEGSRLFVHGRFDADTGQWNSRSLDRVEWLSSQMPTVSREAIAEALSYRNPSLRGLLIRSVGDGSGLIAVKLCNPAPDNCRTVRYLSHGESRIRLNTWVK